MPNECVNAVAISLSDLLRQVGPSSAAPATRWPRRKEEARQLLPTKVSKICRNPNHPRKGDQIRAGPIRQLSDIESIKKRDLLLFVLGINTNLRASDLVRLTVGQVRGLKPLDDLELKERKTGKQRRISVNQSVVDAVTSHLSAVPNDAPDSTPLFASQRGGRALTVSSVHRMVKGWCRAVKLRGNYGRRKTSLLI